MDGGGGSIVSAFLHKHGRYSGSARSRRAQKSPQESFNEDDVFLDAVDHVVLVALETIGGDPAARFALFKGIVHAAQEVAGHCGGGDRPGDCSNAH